MSKWEKMQRFIKCPICGDKLTPGKLCIKDEKENKVYCSLTCWAKHIGGVKDIVLTGEEDLSWEQEKIDYGWLFEKEAI